MMVREWIEERLYQEAGKQTNLVTFGEHLTGSLPACRRATGGIARSQTYGCVQKV